ncbi:Cellulase [Ancylobacter novellus DSM 506]|uniref:cellulase n=1 Tax=Ancylobacter novellus (strain ATCC 8093 / DSM 506 / JCM 20403 / CCM 1077 / IAM 12100 / NBRC 12443 / NCIMB 10456) TaxID=639283 RepID=D7A7Y9_ANCN5|nr:glycosyl hydrolase family 8 [Ancylobacter novellus]ADH90447.1 Cellulase [Ancylobacter novellus DSM 506]
MIRRVLAGFLLIVCGALPVSAQPSTLIPTEAWSAYMERFVDGSGRVVDTANGGISHSEGQGYGMLLAYLAGDRSNFERIWSFTRTELLIRDDGLAAWRWDPNSTPHVTDVNAASDGDLLIAYALARAGAAWNQQPYIDAARRIARAIGRKLLVTDGSRLVLLPGVSGFSSSDRPDGPILNLSYWIFETFPVMAQLAPEFKWSEAANAGLELLSIAQLGPARLPPDWISAPASKPVTVAEGFPPVFGYNSLRISLYLLRAGIENTALQEPFRRSWLIEGGGTPAVVDIPTGRVLARLTDPGYRMLASVLACALNATPIPEDLRRFEPTLYYPSTLYLLGWALVAERYPRCL